MPEIINRLPYQSYTTWNYAMASSMFWGIQQDIINGTITGYGLQDFFQENSDYIVSFKYYPFPITRLYSVAPAGDLHLGKASFSSYQVNGIQRPSSKPISKWFTFSVTRTYNNFLDFAPYTKITLNAPFFESINIDPQIAYGNTVDGYLSVDLTNNHATLFVYIGSNLYDVKTAQMGVEIPVGKTNAQEQKRNNIMNLISLGTGIITTSMGANGGNGIVSAGGVNIISKSLQSALMNNVDRMKGYKGGTGTLDTLQIDKTIYVVVERPNDARLPDPTIKGTISHRTLTLSSVTGYTEIGYINFNPNNADIYDDEISEIVELLHAGVIL